MRSKIVHSFSDKETGFSSVIIQNKYGRFKGKSICCPEDMDAFSQYAGERYAHNRAFAQYAKFRYKQEKIKLNTINSLLKDIEVFVDPKDINKKLLKRINLKKRDYTQSVEDWYNVYTYMNETIQKADEERQKILSRAKKNN